MSKLKTLAESEGYESVEEMLEASTGIRRVSRGLLFATEGGVK